MNSYFFSTTLSSRRAISLIFFALVVLFQTSCSSRITNTGYAVEDRNTSTFQCGPIQYVRSTTISRSQTIIAGPPVVPLVRVAPLWPIPKQDYAYLQVNIKPIDTADATMCPTAIVNGNEFASSEYHSDGSCGYRFDGLELTEEPLLVALENREIGCRIEEAEYKYYETTKYMPLMLAQ